MNISFFKGIQGFCSCSGFSAWQIIPSTVRAFSVPNSLCTFSTIRTKCLHVSSPQMIFHVSEPIPYHPRYLETSSHHLILFPQDLAEITRHLGNFCLLPPCPNPQHNSLRASIKACVYLYLCTFYIFKDWLIYVSVSSRWGMS